MTTVLVTGGAGFIATHTDIELLNKGYDVISVDNYGNSSPVALERVEQITGKPVKRAFIGHRNDRMSGAARTFHKIVGNIGWGLICHDISLTAQIREPTR